MEEISVIAERGNEKGLYFDFFHNFGNVVSAILGAVITLMIGLAWIYDSHETLILSSGAVVSAILISLVIVLRRKQNEREYETFIARQNAWRRAYNDTLSFMSISYVFGEFDEEKRIVRLRIEAMTPSLSGLQVASSVVSDGSVGPLTAKLKVGDRELFLPISESVSSLKIPAKCVRQEMYFLLENAPSIDMEMSRTSVPVEGYILATDRQLTELSFRGTLSIKRKAK